jgi:hypothetical protein
MLWATTRGVARGRRGQQVARAVDQHAVAALGEPGKVGGTVGQVGELVQDNIGAERGHRLREGIDVEHVADHRLGAQLGQHARLLRRARHPGYRVPVGHQQRDQADANNPTGPGDEDPHSRQPLLGHAASARAARLPSPDGHPMVLAPSRDSRMMSAWPAC